MLAYRPPFNQDVDKTLESPFAQAISSASSAKVSFYGHQHMFDARGPYQDGIQYLLLHESEKLPDRIHLTLRTQNGENKFLISYKLV